MHSKQHSATARFKTLWRQDVRPLMIMALILFSIRSSLADWNDVPTGSMKPTILEGDRVFVNKLAYDLKVPFTTWHLAEWSNPRRGEIVVFYSPHDGKRLVKRVIGLPGDTITLDHEKLLINGEPATYQPAEDSSLRDVAPADRASHLFARESGPAGNHSIAVWPAVQALRDYGPTTIPEGTYFMMGDNRDDSFDSRYYGPVPRRSILGRATTIVISLDHNNWWLPRWHRLFHPLDS